MANDSDEDPDTPGKDLSASQTDPSRFASKEKLLKLCTAVAKGRHDYAFAQLGKARRRRRRRRRPQHHHAAHARAKTSGTQPTAGRSPTSTCSTASDCGSGAFGSIRQLGFAVT